MPFRDISFLIFACTIFASGPVRSQDKFLFQVIVNSDEITQQNFKDHCRFAVITPQSDTLRSGADLENFEFSVSVGDTIKWVGISEASSEVQVKKIKFEQGTNIFSKDELDGETTISAFAERKTERDKPFKYKISFKLANQGALFAIDPKIIVNP